MSYTTAQLRDRVAQELGIKAIDQELSDEEAARIEDRIDSITAAYREQGLFWWPDGTIPDQVVDGLTMVMAAWICSSVRKQGQGHEGKLAPGLAMIAAVKPSGQTDTLRTVYY